MITYEPMFATMKKKGISVYFLVEKLRISRALIYRMKHNKPVTTSTLELFCAILDCEIKDIVAFYPDAKETYAGHSYKDIRKAVKSEQERKQLRERGGRHTVY